MKVLILHQHFNTPEKGGALRSYYLAKALVDHGIETVMITGSNEKKYRQENCEGIEVHYLPVAYDNSFGFAARSFSFLKYIKQSVAIAKKIPHVDVCYAISVPLTIGLAAIWLEKKTKVPFIFEVGDLWPDAPVQMGFVKNYFLLQLLFQLEKSIYRKAKSIVALSQPIEDAIEKKVSGKKIHIISNIADCDFYKPEIKEPALEEKFNLKGKFVVSYIGTAGVANGLDHFLECANVSRKADLPIHFILCGDGAMLPYLKVSAERLGLKNISFTGFVSRDQVKEVMNITDAVFVSYKNVPILQTGSPNKYFDGLASGKMIIVNFGGWIKNEIEKAECGIYLNPKQPSEFVNKIEPFVLDKNRVREFQRASR
ncbi:MAG TPA: glycosyltransferase family 4 protein, partial [Cyclobacteriaceae bacterium]|nr:glycosyltransferase family 4 protein [Cyclobacteriaceae bacterium]